MSEWGPYPIAVWCSCAWFARLTLCVCYVTGAFDGKLKLGAESAKKAVTEHSLVVLSCSVGSVLQG